jgi:hypothetical protein
MSVSSPIVFSLLTRVVPIEILIGSECKFGSCVCAHSEASNYHEVIIPERRINFAGFSLIPTRRAVRATACGFLIVTCRIYSNTGL